MSADENDQAESPEHSDESPSSSDEQQKPTADDLSDEGKEKVKEMTQAYDDERPTAVLPGTDGTITGVAINEWLDDDGNPKFGKDEQQQKDEEQDKDEHQEKDEHQDSDKQHADAD